MFSVICDYEIPGLNILSVVIRLLPLKSRTFTTKEQQKITN